jgi:hypothetical protein
MDAVLVVYLAVMEHVALQELLAPQRLARKIFLWLITR